MNFKLNIHPKICTSIAKEYVDNIYKVFLEYIDNSIDSAEEYFDSDKNEYSKQINITVTFDGNDLSNFRVSIDDNSKGISNPEIIFTNIGNSSKAQSSNLNGQFGYGINSFLAVCNKLIVSSKVTDNVNSKKVTVTKGNYEDPDQDLELEETSGIIYKFNSSNSWTRFTLEEFLPDKYNDLSENKLKEEIEKHFESILRRKKLEIKIITRKNSQLICKPFNYSKFQTHSFEVDITKVFYTSSKKYRKTSSIDISKKPILLRIYVSTDKALNRKPFLIVKGRRIQDVSDISSFRTYSKSQIWSHPNVTGYIDTDDHLIPKMGRSDVTGDDKLTKAIFNTIISYESDIKKMVYDALKVNITGKFKKLESILSKATTDIINTKISSMFKGREIPTIGEFSENIFSKDHYLVFGSNDSTTNATVPIVKKSTKVVNKARTQNDKDSKNIGFKVNPDDYAITKSGKLENPTEKKNDLSITLDNDSVPPNDKNNNPQRSSYYDGVIIIYAKHEEFQKRLSNTRDASPKITSRIISYISHEILFQIFSIIEYNQNTETEFLKLFVDSFNDLEDSLKEHVDKNLNELI